MTEERKIPKAPRPEFKVSPENVPEFKLGGNTLDVQAANSLPPSSSASSSDATRCEGGEVNKNTSR
jgi:hypothetical protein